MRITHLEKNKNGNNSQKTRLFHRIKIKMDIIPKIVLMGVSLNHMSAKGEATLCAEDYHVVNHACVPCPSGQSNMPGDDPTGHDTSCDTCKITTNQEWRVCNKRSKVRTRSQETECQIGIRRV